jgi:next-to-BRCA1 protein 1
MAPESPVIDDAPERSKAMTVPELQREFEELLINSSRANPSPSRACPVVSSTACAARTTAHEAPAPVVSSSSTEVPVTVTRATTARDKWFAELAGVTHQRQNAIRNKTGAPSPSSPSVFSVYCNNCQNVIPDEHYHCSTCDDGDFDLCPTCVDAGEVCNGDSHWLIKRFLRNGKVITATTETIVPKAAALESKTTLVQPEEEDEVATRTCNCCIQGTYCDIVDMT